MSGKGKGFIMVTKPIERKDMCSQARESTSRFFSHIPQASLFTDLKYISTLKTQLPIFNQTLDSLQPRIKKNIRNKTKSKPISKSQLSLPDIMHSTAAHSSFQCWLAEGISALDKEWMLRALGSFPARREKPSVIAQDPLEQTGMLLLLAFGLMLCVFSSTVLVRRKYQPRSFLLCDCSVSFLQFWAKSSPALGQLDQQPGAAPVFRTLKGQLGQDFALQGSQHLSPSALWTEI